LLHDAIEDTEATVADLRAGFGSRVCELVRVLSDDPSIADDAARRRALRDQVAGAGPEALAIFAADKVAKVRELRAAAARDPAALGDAAIQGRLEHYGASLTMLEREAPDLPYTGQLRFELWALRELPPRA
jgi:(p)ppGpp synthase/HD superfamily hydrolase